MPIPWAAILTHGPAIVTAAKTLLATQTKQAQQRQQSIDARLDQAEKASVEAARLLEEIAQQVQALTVAQAEAMRKLRVALALSIVATVLATAAVLLSIVK